MNKSVRNLFVSLGCAIAFCLLMILMNSCAVKTIRYTALDNRDKPVTVEANILYWFNDQETKDFHAVAPGGLEVSFANQGSQAKTEVMLEFLKFLDGVK